jgi:hypothetical protein
MAIIYSYPVNTNILATDIILGSSTVIVNGKRKNQTKSFEVADLATYFASVILPPGSYVPYTGAIGPVNLGAYDLTVNSISVGRGGGGLSSNTVVGNNALQNNTSGFQNIAIGFESLITNITGRSNVAVGFQSLYSNTVGQFNTAIGLLPLRANSTGSSNIAIGHVPLFTNTTGSGNVAIGSTTLWLNTIGINNTAVGQTSLAQNTTGNYNTAVGESTLDNNTTGQNNTAIGRRALFGNTTGINNIGIGIDAFTLAATNNNSIVIGAGATGLGSNTVVIGNTSIATTRLRGAVQGGSFVKDSGTAIQYLMADGSISTNGTLFSAVSTIYQATAGTLQNISSAIPSNIFASGNLLKLNAAITTTAASVAIVTIEFYINSAATTVGATLIGRYNGPIGNQYIPMDRFFWVSGTTIYGRDFTASASTSTSNSAFAINSVAIPATQFYIIAQVTTTSTDRAAISSFHVEKS